MINFESCLEYYEESCFFYPVSQEWPKRADKASLLTASGMLLHAFPSMFVSLLHATSWISGKLCLRTTGRIQLFYKIFTQEIINYQFLSYDIESA